MWSYKSIQVPCNIASIFCSGHLLRTEWKYCHGFFSILLDITIKGHCIYKNWLLYKFIYNLQELQILYIISPIFGFLCIRMRIKRERRDYIFTSSNRLCVLCLQVFRCSCSVSFLLGCTLCIFASDRVSIFFSLGWKVVLFLEFSTLIYTPIL